MDPLARTQGKGHQVKVRAIPLTVQGENDTPLEEPNVVGKSGSKCKCGKNPWKPVFCLIMVALLLLLGALGGYWLDRNVFLKRVETDEELAEENPQVEPTDPATQVLTAAEEADLSAKISYYAAAVWDGQPAEAVSLTIDEPVVGELFKRFVTNSLTDSDKISITVNSLKDEYQETGMGAQDTKKTYSLPIARVTERYMSLFGTEVPATAEGYDFCPGFMRDDAARVYYVGTCCGGTGLDWSLLYKESFNVENGVANAFIRLGSHVMDSATEQAAIYNDYLDSATKGLYRTQAELGGAEAAVNFRIDGTNFENFAQYRVTFSKNANGEFSLDSVTRL